jgi:hypothetical protein
MAFLNTSGTFFAWDGAELASGQNWTQVTKSIEVPAGAVRAQTWLLINANPATGYLLFAEPILTRSTTFAALQSKGVVWADNNGSAGARYTIKLKASDADGGAQVGFGLGALKENGQWVSDVRFAANRFAIVPEAVVSETAPTSGNYVGRPWYQPSTDTTKYYVSVGNWSLDPNSAFVPFVVYSAPTTINGVTYAAGVYMTNVIVGQMSATAITAGTLNADRINAVDLSGARAVLGTITVSTDNGKVKSANYSAGAAGWQIDKEKAEFNAITIRDSATVKNNIYGGLATAYGTGTGFFSGWDGSTFKWRVGNPSGARVTWDGSAFSVFGDNDVVLLRSGDGGSIGSNLVPNAGFVGLPKFQTAEGTGQTPWQLTTTSLVFVPSSSNNVSVVCGEIWIPRPQGFTAMRIVRWSTYYSSVHLFTHALERTPVSVDVGTVYEAYAYAAGTECEHQLYVYWFDVSGNKLSAPNGETFVGTFASADPSSSGWPFVGGFVTAPTGAASALLVLRILARTTGTTCTTYFARPFFGPRLTTTGFSPWSPRPVGLITTSNASTYIADAAIGAAQIGVLTAGNIGAGTITATKLGAGAVTAEKINAGAVYVDKINDQGLLKSGAIASFTNSIGTTEAWLGTTSFNFSHTGATDTVSTKRLLFSGSCDINATISALPTSDSNISVDVTIKVKVGTVVAYTITETVTAHSVMNGWNVGGDGIPTTPKYRWVIVREVVPLSFVYTPASPISGSLTVEVVASRTAGGFTTIDGSGSLYWFAMPL